MNKSLSEYTTEQLEKELRKRRIKDEIKSALDSGIITDYLITTNCQGGGISVSFEINGGA
jgi:hypothetical protein